MPNRTAYAVHVASSVPSSLLLLFQIDDSCLKSNLIIIHFFAAIAFSMWMRALEREFALFRGHCETQSKEAFVGVNAF